MTISKSLTFLLISGLLACSGDGKKIGTEQASLIEQENKFRGGFYETQDTLFIRASSNASGVNMVAMKKNSIPQVGMALLRYSQSKCPELKKISLNIKGLSQKHSQFKDDRFIELWSVPKVEIDEWIKSTCEG